MSEATVLPPPTLVTGEQGEAALDTNKPTSQSCAKQPPVVSSGGPITSVPYTLFTARQKMLITVCVSIASVFSPVSATIYVPALPTIANDLGVSVSLVNLSVTSYMIFQGLSPSLWGSVTDVVGRRPVYLATFVVYIGACLGLSFTTNYAELIVFRCLQSTGSASTIAIGAGVIGDITQRRERGGYIGIYSAGSLVGNAIGPILGGIFAERTGWHGIFYFLAAFACFFLIILFLVLPETLRAIVGNGSVSPGTSYINRPVLPWLTAKVVHDSDITLNLPAKKTISFLGPLKMMGQADVFCILLFTAFTYTVWQASLIAMSSLFTSIYHLSEISNGLTFVANGVGAVSASLVTGKILNYDYKCALENEKVHPGSAIDISLDAVQNETSVQSVKQIEHARLKRAPYMILLFLGATLAFGWCLEAKTTIALPIIWTFFTGFTTTAIMGMCSTLVVDWYPDASASATAAINLARCLLGAGGTAVVQPLINKIGVGLTFTVGGAITIASLPFGILTYVKGEHWRGARENKRAEVLASGVMNNGKQIPVEPQTDDRTK